MYGASFDWWRALHMAKKGDMHENIYLLFKYDRVTPEMIVGKAIENILGEFNKKLKEANYNLRQTEPYSPWYNVSEGTICKTNKGSSRKMIFTGSPKKL